jgi:lipopolysaccharide transport system ATP-binding protein
LALFGSKKPERALPMSYNTNAAEKISPVTDAITIDRISKCYKIYQRPQDRLKQIFTGHRKKYFSEFWALHSVSFAVPQGSSLGILGKNGAGKSTLLQIIAGIITPTSGELKVRGRISALLELGTGFNAEFTGRENVYISASILGLSKLQIDERFSDIAAFADIGEFIDQPVKTYSSGMVVRLGFSVAIHVDPEILIVDEALGVGDAKFQAKCYRKIDDLRSAGATILMVSHSTEQIVRHCDRAILIERGELIEHGEPRKVANRYLDLLFGKDGDGRGPLFSANDEDNPAAVVETASRSVPAAEVDASVLLQNASTLRKRPGYNAEEYRWGNREAEIVDCVIGNGREWNTNQIETGDQLQLLLKAQFHKEIARPIYGLTVKTPDGVTIYGSNSRDWNGANEFNQRKPGDIVHIKFSLKSFFGAGHLFISLGIAEEQNGEIVPLDRRYDLIEFVVKGSGRGFGFVDCQMTVEELQNAAV